MRKEWVYSFGVIFCGGSGLIAAALGAVGFVVCLVAGADDAALKSMLLYAAGGLPFIAVAVGAYPEWKRITDEALRRNPPPRGILVRVGPDGLLRAV